MNILGISSFYHDSAAALVCDGVVVAAAQEERFTRIKHDPNYPKNAINFCLEYAKLKPADIDYVVFYEKPFLKFERLLETYLTFVPRGVLSFLKAMPIWIKDKLFQKDFFIKQFTDLDPDVDWQKRLLFSEHHLSHAASAFYPSPFDEAIVLTMDGVGEAATSSVYIGKGSELKPVKEITFPHSLGLLYTAFTYYTGFKVNSGEYKLMGLAPYGEPKYVDLIKDNLIDIKDDGSFRLDMKYFNYCVGLTMTSKKFDKLFGGPPRKPESQITQREMDLAASIQVVTEEVILKMAKSLKAEFNIPNLCLAGGVSLNCVANGKIVRENVFEDVWVQPAAGDAGGALGAALAAHYIHLSSERVVDNSKPDSQFGSYLGPQYQVDKIEQELNEIGAVFETLPYEEVIKRTANELNEGKAVGWFQNRMEFGPRALGTRSILGNPSMPEMQSTLNLKIKFRESFRPFAPAVLNEKISEWFEFNKNSPYMLMVAPVKQEHRVQSADNSLFGIEKLKQKRSTVPAITHVDYSARLQSVHKETNKQFYDLLQEFDKLSGVPILINTSFNVRGEPIVCSPTDAFRCFMGTGLDSLVIGQCVLKKTNQNQELLKDYKLNYELD